MNTNERTRKLIASILREQATFDKVLWQRLLENRPTPEDVDMSVIDAVADWYGIPADNTVETQACEIANATGEWPSCAYCRDGIYAEWHRVYTDESTIEEFMAALESAANDDDNSP